MVMERNLVKVGNREVKKRYIGNKLIFEDLGDKTEIISGEEIYTDKADDSVVHVEIDGKSYQDGVPTPDYPIEIHSLNDFDVVSSKAINMFNSKDFIKNGIDNGLPETNTTLIEVDGYSGFQHRQIEWVEKYFNYLEGQFEEKTSYTLSFKYDFTGNNELSQSGIVISYTTGTGDVTTFRGLSDSGEISIETDPGRTVKNISVRGWRYGGNFKVWKISLIKTSDFKEFVPHVKDITKDTNHPLIDKINLLLDEPLRSVGDVKDRLFRDSDGIWKIERNITNKSIEDMKSVATYSGGNEYHFDGGVAFLIYYPDNQRSVSTNDIKSSHFKKTSSNNFNSPSSEVNTIHQLDSTRFSIRVPENTIGVTYANTTQEKETVFRNWANANNIRVQYILGEPTIETLDQELQDKLNNLRSFQDSNYIYTIVNDKTDILPTHVVENLKPTLHATFKSKGWYDYYKKTLLK